MKTASSSLQSSLHPAKSLNTQHCTLTLETSLQSRPGDHVHFTDKETEAGGGQVAPLLRSQGSKEWAREQMGAGVHPHLTPPETPHKQAL